LDEHWLHRPTSDIPAMVARLRICMTDAGKDLIIWTNCGLNTDATRSLIFHRFN
jgi:hypothetical protein